MIGRFRFLERNPMCSIMEKIVPQEHVAKEANKRYDVNVCGNYFFSSV
jgi:hypothetical protein